MLQNQGSNLLAMTLVCSFPFDEWILIPESLQQQHDSLKGKIKKFSLKIERESKTWKIGSAPNMRTTASKIESSSSIAAACAFPVGAITAETGLTAERVPTKYIPF